MQDETFMLLALEEARLALAEGETPVGCVIVRDGRIIARGHNRRHNDHDPTAHAEILAIRRAASVLGDWRLSGCTLYVTLEPCPMCAGAIINARIPHVYYGAKDPKAGSCGSVVNLFELPYNHKPELTGGIMGEECAQILTEFFRRLRQKKDGNKGI